MGCVLPAGQGQAPARLQSSQGHGQAGEAHHSVDHYVGILGDRRQGALTGQDFRTRRYEALQLGRPGGIGDRHPWWPPPAGLLGQESHRGGRAERSHLEVAPAGLYDFEGLGADGPGTAGEADGPRRGHLSS